MNFFSSIPFRVASIPGRLNYPKHSLTLVVKGAFDLSPGARATMAEEQPFPTGDEFYSDDEEMHGGPRYESDFAYFKPRADLLLVGKCYPPGGRPTQMCQVAFGVGNKSKTLNVIGNRRWERRGLSWRVTEPEPFTQMELRYENSFGGEKPKRNPIGKGSRAVKDDEGNEVHPLPNIEDPLDPIESRRSSPGPAGFGPLGRMWQMRLGKMGTYKGKYLETSWPWFPEDFDWTHFNAAPEDMQLEGYLRGDEELYFENLHPVHARYQSRLPGLRVRCFLNKLAAPDAEQTQFVEVPMSLDALWVDMEAEKLVLVWRGWCEVLSEDYEEVQDVFITSEPLEHPPASLEQCHQQFLDKRAEEEEAGVEAPEEPGAADQEEAASGPPNEKPAIDAAQLEAQTNALLAQIGIDVETLPLEVKERQARFIKKLSETDPKKVAEMERQELDNQLRQAMAKLDLDPDYLPPVTAKAKAEQLRFMKELGVKDPHLNLDPELEKMWALTAALMPKAGLDPENLDALIEQTKQQLSIEDEEETEPAEAPVLTREVVRERAARGESFAGEDLHGLDLSQLELRDIDFSGANLAGVVLTDANLEAAILADADLTGASLSRANLTGANLAGADLSNAKLNGASLKDADLTACNLSSANLVGAVLTDTVFEKAQMAGAVCDRVDAKDAIFSGAELTGTSFKESHCAGADFSKAVLDHADFTRAQLAEASLEGVVARQINLAEADLSALKASGGSDFVRGVFWRAVGPESIWEDADLTEADFRGARMHGAIFTAACLKQANLTASDMRSSRFNKADLSEAQMIQMNLFQGSLERADLTGANLSGSNMYEVEFLDAVIEKTDMGGANLKMTKLHS